MSNCKLCKRWKGREQGAVGAVTQGPGLVQGEREVSSEEVNFD